MKRSWKGGGRALAVMAALATAAPLGAQMELSRTPSRFAMADGLRIHFKSFGTGRRGVVFVHGWLSDITAWRYQVDALSARGRLVVLDLPGHGRSSLSPGGYSMTGFVDAVEAAMNAAGVDRAVLVGHSMGAAIVRDFYRRHPDRVLGLVVVDGALQAPPLDSASVATALAPFEAADYRASIERMIATMYPEDMQAGLRQMILAPALTTPQRAAVGTLRAIYDPAVWKADRIDVPLLVVVAKGSRWPPSYRAWVERLGSQVRYEELDGVAHYLMLEKPEAFNPILTVFLDSIGVLR